MRYEELHTRFAPRVLALILELRGFYVKLGQARYGEIWGDMGRYGEMLLASMSSSARRDMGRYGEI